MKYFKIINMFFILLTMGCSAQNFNEINYKAHTRGSAVEIKVKKNVIKYQTNQNKGVYQLSKKDLKCLNDIMGKINLKGIQNLKAPTNKRYSDGALIAEFKIKVKEIEYRSCNFDAGNPPKELKKLEEFLISLLELKD